MSENQKENSLQKRFAADNSEEDNQKKYGESNSKIRTFQPKRSDTILSSDDFTIAEGGIEYTPKYNPKPNSKDNRRDSSHSRRSSSEDGEKRGYSRRSSEDGENRGYSRRSSSEDGEKRGYSRRSSSEDGEKRGYSRRSSSENGEKRGYSRRSSSEDGEKRGYSRRSSEDGEKRGYSRRSSSEDGEKRGYSRRPSSEDGEKRGYSRRSSEDGENRGYSRRSSSEDGENRGYSRRSSEDGENRGYSRRSSSEDGEKRGYSRRSSEDGEKRGYSRKKDYEGKSDDNRRSKRSFSDKDGFRADKPQRERKSGSSRKQSSEDDTIRLNKFIADAGVCSRREADTLITSGSVKVNGVIVDTLGSKVKKSDKVQIGDETLHNERLRYLLLNKPKGYITTMSDPQKRNTVLQLIDGACKERIFPVGRLDRNTSGLLIFTNDGELANKLMHPSSKVAKVYHVELDKPLTKNDMTAISEGIELEDGLIAADDIAYSSPDSKKEVGIEIHSGKNQVVRRIFQHLGYEVVKLDRSFLAGLTKKNLPRGEWRFLTEKEVAFLKML